MGVGVVQTLPSFTVDARANEGPSVLVAIARNGKTIAADCDATWPARALRVGGQPATHPLSLSGLFIVIVVTSDGGGGGNEMPATVAVTVTVDVVQTLPPFTVDVSTKGSSALVAIARKGETIAADGDMMRPARADGRCMTARLLVAKRCIVDCSWAETLTMDWASRPQHLRSLSSSQRINPPKSFPLACM